MNPASSFSEILPMPEDQRSTLTLLEVKDDTKMVLVALPGSVQIPAHKVPYPASLLLLSGSVEVMLGEAWTRVVPGTTVPIPEGILHAVKGVEASYFIVTHLRGFGSKVA